MSCCLNPSFGLMIRRRFFVVVGEDDRNQNPKDRELLSTCQNSKGVSSTSCQCTHTCTHTNMHTHTHTQTCTHTNMHTCTHHHHTLTKACASSRFQLCCFMAYAMTVEADLLTPILQCTSTHEPASLARRTKRYVSSQWGQISSVGTSQMRTL